MTAAAERFTDSIVTAWDHRQAWVETARHGLSESDEAALRSICDETGDDYGTASSEVLAFVRDKVS